MHTFFQGSPLLKMENTPVLETDRLILRAFQEKDVDDLYELLSAEEVNKYLPWFPLKNRDEAEKHLHEHFLGYYGLDHAYRYAICLKKDNRPIGYINISNSESNDLGYCLKKEFWHCGIATESSKAVINRVKEAGYPYITATHDIHNSKSGDVMKRSGMTYKYSYKELWEPKNTLVTFRMYQINFDGNNERTYREYWNRYSEKFVEEIICS